MRDIAWVVGMVTVTVLLTIALQACKDYRECRRGVVVLVEGPARAGVPSHERCIDYLFR